MDELFKTIGKQAKWLLNVTNDVKDHTRELDALKAAVREKEDLHARHLSLGERVDYLEKLVGESAEKHTQVKSLAEALEKSQVSTLADVQALRTLVQEGEPAQKVTNLAEEVEALRRQVREGEHAQKALRISDTERNQQLQHLTKTCADLAESNRGIYADLEACRSMNRSLEASLRSSDEKMSCLECQCHEGLFDVKSFAKEVADKALKAATDQLEETCRGVRAELQGSQAAERQLETRLERVFAMATQCSEGLERATRQLKELERRCADTAARLEAEKDELASSLDKDTMCSTPSNWEALSSQVADLAAKLTEVEGSLDFVRENEPSSLMEVRVDAWMLPKSWEAPTRMTMPASSSEEMEEIRQRLHFLEEQGPSVQHSISKLKEAVVSLMEDVLEEESDVDLDASVSEGGSRRSGLLCPKALEGQGFFPVQERVAFCLEVMARQEGDES